MQKHVRPISTNLNVTLGVEGEGSEGLDVQVDQLQVHGAFAEDREDAQDAAVQLVHGVGLKNKCEHVISWNDFLQLFLQQGQF